MAAEQAMYNSDEFLRMKSPNREEHLVARSLALSKVLIFTALLFPLLAAAGWLFDISIFKQGHPALPEMQPNTILGLALGAIAIFLSSEGRKRNLGWSSVLAAVIFLLGLLTLSEYATGWNLGIDQLFVSDGPTAVQPYPGRPSPQAAANFILVGVSIIVYNLFPNFLFVGQLCILTMIVNSIIAITGYIFSTEQYFGFPVYLPAIGLAINTAISFVLLAMAVLFSRPMAGMMSLVTSETRSGGIARRILLTAIVSPPLVGFVTRLGVALEWYDVSAQASLFVVLVVGLILETTWTVTRYAEKEELRAKGALYELRQSQERLDLALRGADLGSWDWEIKTGKIDLNSRWAEMRGFHLDEIKPHVDSWTSGIHPDDLPRVQKTLDDYLHGRIPDYEIEFRVLTRFGEWKWILDRGKVFERDSDGHPSRMAGTELDISERKRLEMALQLSEAKASGVISISADAIISIDEDQNITLFNEGAENIFGYSKAEVIGKHLDILIPERFRAIHRQHVRQFSEENISARRAGHRGRPISGIRKNGDEFPADAAISKLHIGDNRIFTVVLRDISDQQQYERQLQRAIKSREDVLAIVSHDLKNPVSSISLTAQLLRRLEHVDVKELREFADSVQRSTTQMQRLIGDLLDFSKIESGTFSVDIFAERIDDVIRPIVEGVRIQAESRSQVLDVGLAPDLPLVACDAVRIGQVVSNLLGNAIKFTPEGGSIGIRAEQRDELVVVTISDSGPGIPSEQLPKIFDRFWQAEETKRLGSGLGLAIAKGIVESHAGKIWVESGVDKGSAFHFTIPLASPLTKKKRAVEIKGSAAQEFGQESLRGIHVLIVDDSPEVLSILKRILVGASAKVTEARSVKEALTKLSQVRPDVILTDIEMPEEDGFELIKKVHHLTFDQGCKIPIAALTAHEREEELKKIEAAGFDTKLSKPVNASNTIATVKRLASQPQTFH